MRICFKITTKVCIRLPSTQWITVYLYTKHPVHSVTHKDGDRRVRDAKDDDKGWAKDRNMNDGEKCKRWRERDMKVDDGRAYDGEEHSAMPCRSLPRHHQLCCSYPKSFVAHVNGVSHAWSGVRVEGAVLRWLSRPEACCIAWFTMLCHVLEAVKSFRFVRIYGLMSWVPLSAV